MSVKITFLGHSGFLLESGGSVLAIDPFLTGNPLARHRPGDLACTHIALTHGHGDHLGDTLAIARRTGATVIACHEITELLREQGLEKLEGGNHGGQIATAFGFVAFTQAIHSSSHEGRYLGMPCGLVVKMGDLVFYHCGDTALFSDMKTIGQWYQPDVTAVPVGDRYTMDARQGARAAEWIGAKVAIPVHYKTFPVLAQDIEGFSPQGVTVKEMQPGETWSWKKS